MIHSHLGEISALLVAIFWTITALAFESASKIVGSLSVNLIRLVLAFIFLTIFTWLYRGLGLPTDAGYHQWIWLSLSGFVGFVFGDLCLLKSFTMIGSRLAMLIMTLAPPMAAITGFITLNEHLSNYSIFGMVLTLSGVALAILNHKSPSEPINSSNQKSNDLLLQRHNHLNLLSKFQKLNKIMPVKGFLFAFGGAIGQAFGLILSKKGMAGYDAFASTQIRIITGIIGFLAIILIMRRGSQTISAFSNRSAMSGIWIGSVFGPFLGVSLSLISLKYTSTGIASTIMATVPILIILPAILIFKQKVTFWEIVGAFLSVLGVGLFFIK